MRAIVTGKVVDVERREYVNRDGVRVTSFDAFIASDNPRYGAERISGPEDMCPIPGTFIAMVCNVTAKEGKRGPWLSVWAVEAADLDSLAVTVDAA
jgi:hypothetical protein